VQQARELGDFLQDQNIGAIYSSPWYRCMQVADTVHEKLQLPIRVENGLCEWFPPATPGTGLHSQPTVEECKRFFSAVVDRPPFVTPPRTGETVEALHERVASTIDQILAELDGREDAPTAILLLGHGAIVLPVGRALVGDRQFQSRAGTCALSKFNRTREGRLGAFTCEYSGRADFLSGGEQKHWDLDSEAGVLEWPGTGDEA
jgi:transcription factor C subunit 7